MERKGIEEFLRLVTENKAVQEEIKSIGGDMDSLAAYAREQGYDVSPQELRKCREQAVQLAKIRMRGLAAQAQRPEASVSPGVREFYALLALGKTDKEVGKRLEELAEGDPEQLIAYGREKGFTFTGQDLQLIGNAILEPTDELSEEELEMVAGGTTLVAAFLVGGFLVAAIAIVGVGVGFGVAGLIK